MSRRVFWIGLAAIVAVAVLLRVGVGLELRHTPNMADPVDGSDMRTYWDLARATVQGRFPLQFYYQPFYPNVFLPVVILLFGASPIRLACVQAALGGSAVLLTGWIGARSFGRLAGWLAAGCLALARYHIFLGQFALSDPLGAFLVVAVVAGALRAIDRPAWWRWLVLGFACGCAATTRVNLTSLVPGILALLAWRHWRERGRLVVFGALFLALALAVELPFSLVNRQTTGHWAGPATSSEITFALGNTPESAPGLLAYPPTFEAWKDAAWRAGPARVSVVRSWLGWIRREPLAWAELKLRTAILFWDAGDLSNNVNLAVDGLAESRLLRLPVLVPSGAILALGLTGFLLAVGPAVRQRRVAVAFLLWSILALYASTVAGFIVGRFRLALVPLLCVLAGHALATAVACARAVGRRQGRAAGILHAVGVGVTAAVALLVVYRGFEVYQARFESRIVRVVRPHGVLATVGDDRRVYDHGPEPLGGWVDVRLPSGVTTTLVKGFSLPMADLAGWAPVRLRVPVRFDRAGSVAVEVNHAGRQVGAQQVTSGPSDAIAWIAVDLTAMHEGETGQNPTFDVLIRPSPGATVETIVDRLRDYGRTLLSASGLLLQPGLAAAESCAELDLAPSLPQAIASAGARRP